MEKRIIKNLLIILLLGFVFSLVGCKADQQKQTKKKETIVVAKKKARVTQLFFKGSLMPIENIPVVSPVDGRLAEIKFIYGNQVSKGELLARINSTQLADDYRKAVSDYLQKKDAYDNGSQSYEGNVALYKAGIISKEEFLSEQSQYENTVLSFFQSRYNLEKVLKKAKIDLSEIETLTLKDVQKVDQVLRRSFSRINVYSPGTGVALFPTQQQSDSGDSGNQKSGRLRVGDQLKSGQLMLNIGDLTGLSAEISVSEVNINRIKVGMKALVTGDAFPGITLNGYVSQVSAQANPQQGGDGGSGLSTFNVKIRIPKINETQRAIIHVGMTARIEIDIKEKPMIMLPIKAVTTSNGKTTVKILQADGTKKTVSVSVGDTTPEGEISILSGIKVGDKVVIDD